MAKIIPYNDLPNKDLIVDAVYQGKPGGELSDLNAVSVGVKDVVLFRVSDIGNLASWGLLLSSADRLIRRLEKTDILSSLSAGKI